MLCALKNVFYFKFPNRYLKKDYYFFYMRGKDGYVKVIISSSVVCTSIKLHWGTTKPEVNPKIDPTKPTPEKNNERSVALNNLKLMNFS